MTITIILFTNALFVIYLNLLLSLYQTLKQAASHSHCPGQICNLFYVGHN